MSTSNICFKERISFTSLRYRPRFSNNGIR